MRKLIILLIVLVAIIAMIPFVDGYLFKKEFINVITSMAASGNDKSLKVEITEYHLGWLHSSASIRVSSTDPETMKHFPEGITIDSEITNGPFVYDSTNDKYTFAYAYVISRTYLPSNVQKILMPTQQDQPVFEVDTLASSSNTWISRIKVAPISIPELGVLTFGDSTTTLNFSMQDGQVTSFNTTHDMGAILLRNLSGNASLPSFTLQPTHSKLDATRNTAGYWSTSATFTGSGFSINWPNNGSMTLSGIDGKSFNGIDANNLSQLNTEINIKSISSPTYFISSFSDVHASFGMNNLNPAGFSKYNDKVIDAQTAASNLKNLLTPTSSINWKLSFNSNPGALSSSTNISIKPKADIASMQLFDIFSILQLESNNKIADPLLNKLVIKYLEKMDEITAQMQPADTTTNAPSHVFQDLVGNLFRDGKITMQQSMDIFGAISDNPTEQVFAQKIMQIAPKNAAELTQAYHMKLVQDAAQAAASKPLAETRDQRAQQMIATWIQQGYLIKEGNDYIANVSDTDGTFKINGKPLNVPDMPPAAPQAMPAPAMPVPVGATPAPTH